MRTQRIEIGGRYQKADWSRRVFEVVDSLTINGVLHVRLIAVDRQQDGESRRTYAARTLFDRHHFIPLQ